MKPLISSHLLILSLLMLNNSALSAVKMDIKTHNSLIQKLESVVEKDKSDTMIEQSQLYYRLADLYSERSRLLSMENEGRGEQSNKKLIDADRRNAIQIYKKILASLNTEQKSHALLQTAHLYSLLHEADEAIKIYNSIINAPKLTDTVTLSLAMVQLGDIWFYRAEYKNAEEILTQSLKYKNNPRLSYAYYRLAWCSYNTGRVDLAKSQLITLLQKSELFITQSGESDNSFKEEVSRDLATVISSNSSITDKDIDTLIKLTPENARQKNLIYLASELDRTGKKNSSVVVWKRIGKQNLSFEDELEGQIRITKIQYDLGQRAQLLKEIDNSIKLLKSEHCPKSSECLVGQQNLRKILTQWGNAEQRVPSAELVLGFKKYNDAFNDEEMSSWAGHTALKTKMYKEAYNLFVSSVAILTKNPEKLKSEKGKKVLEGSLLGAIEAAENINDNQLKIDAYNLFLNTNPNGSKRFEVKYQRAYTYYKSNKYELAYNEFYNLVGEGEAPKDLREKSSELAIDSLVILKREDEIEKASSHFANQIASKRDYFQNINRKSILNQSEKIINKTDDKVSDLEFQWTKLNRVETKSWPIAQKKILLKNKMVIANKLKNQGMILSAADEIINDNRFTQAEHNKALEQKAWLYEKQLDFKQALNILKQIQLEKRERADLLLKLALLTDISKGDPSDYYKKFITISHDTQKKQYAHYQIILHSNNPHKEFKVRSSFLRANPKLYLLAGIFAFEKSKDLNLAKSILKQTHVKGSFEYHLLSRHLELENMTKQILAIKKIRLNTSNEKRLQKNLLLKINSLNDLERLTRKYISQKDNSLQILALAHLSNENRLLAQDIQNLPIPRKLTDEQKRLYQDQIQLKIRPFVSKSESVRLRVIQMYEDSVNLSVFKDLYDLSEQASKPGSYLAKIEIAHLRRSAGLIGILDDPFITFTRERHKVASEAEKAEQRIHENPYNYSDLETLIRAQKELGSGSYVAYLEEQLVAAKRGAN